jgi:hypothetical protein
MSGQVKASGLLPIILIKQKDRSIKGTLPSGQVVTWPSDQSGRPTRRSKKVMLNCYWWEPVWLDAEPDAETLRTEREKNANAVFEQYDFGLEVDEAGGWDTSEPLNYTRMVYGEGARFNLHILFHPYSAVVVEGFAYNMASGARINSYPAPF